VYITLSSHHVFLTARALILLYLAVRISTRSLDTFKIWYKPPDFHMPSVVFKLYQIWNEFHTFIFTVYRIPLVLRSKTVTFRIDIGLPTQYQNEKIAIWLLKISRTRISASCRLKFSFLPVTTAKQASLLNPSNKHDVLHTYITCALQEVWSDLVCKLDSQSSPVHSVQSEK